MSEEMTRIFAKLDDIARDISDIKATNATFKARISDMKEDIESHSGRIAEIDRGGWKILGLFGATVAGWLYAILGK